MIHDKPAISDNPIEPWPRIAVDPESEAFTTILRTATGAYDDWYWSEMRPTDISAHIRYMGVREALLHLLELGLIDIDEERLSAAYGIPVDRRSFRQSGDQP